MKVRELGKAILEFELNDIPMIIKKIIGLLVAFSLWLMHFISSLVIKYWYCFIAFFIFIMVSGKQIYWRDEYTKYSTDYISFGDLIFEYTSFYIMTFAALLYFLFRKIKNKLDHLFKQQRQ